MPVESYNLGAEMDLASAPGRMDRNIHMRRSFTKPCAPMTAE